MLKRISPLQSEPVYRVDALRQIESEAARTLPPHSLMQRAGSAVARLAQACFPHARRVVVLAGAGNNGGDGLVAATQLHQAGRDVLVLACGAETLNEWRSRLPADAAWAWAQAQTAEVRCAWDDHSTLPEADLYIDALLGLGLRGPMRAQMAEIIQKLNAQRGAPVLSVDLPSGLDADTGAATDVCVRANVTLSLLGLKPGLCTGPASSLCGTLWHDDLGVSAATHHPHLPIDAIWLGADLIRPLLPDLAQSAHKGQRGDVAVIGGAAGMTGAALLAARAAAQLGAGRVFVGLLDHQAPAVDLLAPELMLRSPTALLDAQGGRTCLLIGPGAGCDDTARSYLAQALAQPVPLVLDADALNLLAVTDSLQTLLRQRNPITTLLTPHPLEAARLLGASVQAIESDRLTAARTLAQRFACWIVLKGRGTLIVSPQQTAWINATGNGLLATAGSGDVLAGSAAALLAATGKASSVLAAVWLHGQAAIHYARKHGPGGLTAATLPSWMAASWADLPYRRPRPGIDENADFC
ncbi:MAG TPA: NAD(P)H-hydrate dehydratase [Thiomonas arsenitoxydans]|uniref:NAD(P)H-hydrate dehydratase n=1 Tax=Thiomonas TaxID=32012 RepID=UPI00257EA140|nr:MULTISPECIES: NAD(P)H-hydrate dehydratase [Thiomonas]HML81943.1 NAD(P)H-hydrate dehydratase [Thiomonas arsenitoxydans]